MADLVRLAHYPFLPGVRDAVRESGADMMAVLESPRFEAVRARARDRVETSLAGTGIKPVVLLGDRDALDELLSVAVARMLVVRLAEKALVPRYAGAESDRLQSVLANDPDSVRECADALGLRLVPGDADGTWSMHVADYLRAAPLGDAEWKLIRRPVVKGNVLVDHDDAVRLAKEALKHRIAAELEAERTKPLPPELAAALAPLVAALQPKLDEARASWSSGDFGPVQPGLFPPCVKETFEALKRSENVPHHGRFAFATFLRTVGWNAEQIMDYLSATPNFDREKSRYQIEHITGERGVEAYMVPNCSTMQTNGICPLDKRDRLCMAIKNPLSYYRVKTRDNPVVAKESTEAVPSAPGASPGSPRQTPVEVKPHG